MSRGVPRMQTRPGFPAEIHKPSVHSGTNLIDTSVGFCYIPEATFRCAACARGGAEKVDQEGHAMRRFSLVAAMAALLLALTAGPAVAAPLHLHCLETASGDVVSIGRGVTAHAPHDTAFHNLHRNVHVAVFMNGNHPLEVAAVAPTGPCPTSID